MQGIPLLHRRRGQGFDNEHGSWLQGPASHYADPDAHVGDLNRELLQDVLAEEP